MSNKLLSELQTNPRDEYYTRYDDIYTEVMHYKDYFKDKTVYCNCECFNSNFVNFFSSFLNDLGLKRLIATRYNPNGKGMLYIETPNTYPGWMEWPELEGDGSYDSQECLEYLDECDIVVTNPPFSLITPFVTTILDHQKDFLILAPELALSNLTLSKLFYEDKFRFGYMEGRIVFENHNVPANRNVECRSVSNIRWITTLPVDQSQRPKLTYSETADIGKLLSYDNYNAREVSYLSDLPDPLYDTEQIYGVPVSFLKYWDRNEWDILRIGHRCFHPDAKPTKEYKNLRVYVTGVSERERMSSEPSPYVIHQSISSLHKKYYIADNADGILERKFSRVFIRAHKEPGNMNYLWRDNDTKTKFSGV